MNAQQVQALINKAAKAWIESDAEAFANLFMENGEFIVPGKRWVGPAAIRDVVNNFASNTSDVTIDISQTLIDLAKDEHRDNVRVMLEWHWENTETASGKRIVADDAIAIDIQKGGISRWREYIDEKTPASQVSSQ